MAKRLVAVDDTNWLLPQEVRDAYQADVQQRVNQGVIDSVANMPTIAQAVRDRLAALLSDNVVAPLLTSATASRMALDARLLRAPDATGSDDTAVLQNWINALPTGSAGTLYGAYKIANTLTIPAGITLAGRGATITGTGSTAYDMVRLSDRSRITGVEIVGGTRTGGHGIRLSNVAGAAVTDCYIHNLAGTNVNDGKGISADSGSSKYLLRGNRVENTNAQGISIDFASYGTVEGNQIDSCYHGIQWWGGDSAQGSTIGVHHLVITGNRVRNVQGGIWGSLGQYITVTGNEVDGCGDVGIDFEGCQDSVATGNTVQRCVNAGLGVFYGASRILFADNTVDNAGYAGSGFKAFTSTTSTYIQVVDNLFRTDQGIAVASDQNGLGDSTIRGNRIVGVTQGVIGMRFIDGGNLSIIGNELRVACPNGIRLEGATDSRIEGNEIVTLLDGAASNATSAGIYLVWRNSQFSSKRNRIRNNVIRGFSKGIFDDCYGDFASYNLIENNIASTVFRRNGNGYTGVISNNRNETTHAVVGASVI